jgi:hypothetical protein
MGDSSNLMYLGGSSEDKGTDLTEEQVRIANGNLSASGCGENIK